MKVLTFGVFDYFHLGHLRLFKQCRQYGDCLIVAVQNGEYITKYKPNVRVLYSTEERVEIIESVRLVDEVLVYDEISSDLLEKINFDVLALGEDHKGNRFDAMIDWCSRNEKRVVRLKRTEGISSSAIKDQLDEELNLEGQ